MGTFRAPPNPSLLATMRGRIPQTHCASPGNHQRIPCASPGRYSEHPLPHPPPMFALMFYSWTRPPPCTQRAAGVPHHGGFAGDSRGIRGGFAVISGDSRPHGGHILRTSGGFERPHLPYYNIKRGRGGWARRWGGRVLKFYPCLFFFQL